MMRAVDVADYILGEMGDLTAMKLEKLLYYSQAWHLAWTEHPLFNDKIEAWRNGPVVPSLYFLHKECFKLKPGFFAEKIKPDLIQILSDDQKDIVKRVLEFYGSKDPHWLSQLTHMEDPWKNARPALLGELAQPNEEITHHSMFNYYSSL
ncbi:MAG: DUF4065 domain-containing protein [Parachlamydiaceae bacterium]|nr:DUF4065 domain-containing protein [Parachlamydiaceae bacterium]